MKAKMMCSALGILLGASFTACEKDQSWTPQDRVQEMQKKDPGGTTQPSSTSPGPVNKDWVLIPQPKPDPDPERDQGIRPKKSLKSTGVLTVADPEPDPWKTQR